MKTEKIKVSAWGLLRKLCYTKHELVDIDLDGDVVVLTVVPRHGQGCKGDTGRFKPLKGIVTEGKCAYQRLTKVKPVLHYYGDDYTKYGCPICEALGNKHQITYGSVQCSQCNVNLSWEGIGDE